jgi:hypothetical protein
MDPSGNATALKPGAPGEAGPPGVAATATTAPASPEKALAELRAKLLTAESDVSARQQSLQALRADVGALEKSAGDIDKVVDAYGAARPKLTSREDDVARFLECEKAVVDEKVGDEKEAVERAYEAVGARLTGWEEELEKHRTALSKLEEDRRARMGQLIAAQAVYDELKGRQKRVEDLLKEVESLRALLEKADKAGDGPRMLVIYKLSTALLDDVGEELVTTEVLRGSLETAWLGVNRAQEQLRDTIDQQTKAALRVQELTTKIDALESSRVEATLKHYQQTPADDSASGAAAEPDGDPSAEGSSDSDDSPDTADNSPQEH